jgi:hypothetical protein
VSSYIGTHFGADLSHELYRALAGRARSERARAAGAAARTDGRAVSAGMAALASEPGASQLRDRCALGRSGVVRRNGQGRWHLAGLKSHVSGAAR